MEDFETVVLPSSIFMFRELGKLKLRGQKVLLSIEEGTEEESSVSWSTPRCLDLSTCNLSDEFLGIFLARFPNVQQLNLSNSNFTILPACIQNCHLLRLLYIVNCKNLQEIRGIPPNIETLDASDSTSLSCWSREILLNKKLHEEVGKKKFILPGKSIPSWFEHQSSGQPISFWFRNKFPAISISLLSKEFDHPRFILPHLKLVSNGNHNSWNIFHDQTFYNFRHGHIYIYDLEDNAGLQFQQNEWNQALVSLSDVDQYGERQLRPEVWACIQIGVHIIKERTCMDDIQFTDPLLKKEDHNAADMRDYHNHHMHQQPSRELGLLSHPPPTLSDNYNWDFLDNTPTRAYTVPRTSVLRSAMLNVITGESSDTMTYYGIGETREEEVHAISTSTMSSTSIDKYLSNVNETEMSDDVEMDAFYASIDIVSNPRVSDSHQKLVTPTPSDEEMRKTLRSVQSFLYMDASILLYPELCGILKAKLDYLSKLSADHGGISREMSRVISEASQVLIHWSRDYSEARTKIDSIMSQLQSADELEMSLESNKKRFLEVVALQTEQLNAIKSNMSVSQSEPGISRKKKREIFEEGKAIKAELDEFKKNVPQWKQEHTLAKKTQANIIAKWSRLRESFQNIEKD
ncbi:hypothetical protein PIB30_031721 [Stylosanthes scabra]|uniref:Disease resistance protein RPS4B/Roq1-like leucine-rich repeats domain-containing protein n=1 Tax=Stylosanthes scabra TaxID=79078 RepID=A0ABU6TC62_9FABA|nr:hypothetical protein [Stylosanthes scabra]